MLLIILKDLVAVDQNVAASRIFEKINNDDE